jgi:hypothetical protein
MSKLVDLLRRATRAEPAPLGFVSGSGKPPATMLIVALVGEHWARGVGEAAGAGADVVLLTGQAGEKEVAEAISAAEGLPCGLLTLEADAEQLSRLREAGLDFFVLGPQAPASILQDDEGCFLLQLGEELTDAQLRTLGALPLEALYVDLGAAPLTIRRQMQLQRISGLARKPLLLPVRPDAQQGDLLSLREADVVLVAVDLAERGAADAIRRLRGVIEALPPRRRRRLRVGREMTLLGSAHEGDEEEEEEEDEDEEEQ